MKAEELAFLNRQLAGMLRDGIPLEGALRGTARELGSGHLQGELAALETALASGVPLTDAIERRAFPPVYRKLVRVGVASGDLPGALLAAADYFESASALGRRVQAVMVYPACMLAVVTGVSALVSWQLAVARVDAVWGNAMPPASAVVLPWLVPSLLALIGLAWAVVQIVPALRDRVAWTLPVLRDARVARASDTLAVLVRQGCPLPEAVALLAEIEAGTPLGDEMGRWQRRLAAGAVRFSEVVGNSDDLSLFPPLFRWLVSQAGSRLGDGLAAAGRFYADRSRHRMDLILHGALPIALLLVGFLVVMQFTPVIAFIVQLIDRLGSDGGGA